MLATQVDIPTLFRNSIVMFRPVEPPDTRERPAPVHHHQGEEARVQPDGQPGSIVINHPTHLIVAQLGQAGGHRARPGGSTNRRDRGQEDWQPSHHWV